MSTTKVNNTKLQKLDQLVGIGDIIQVCSVNSARNEVKYDYWLVCETENTYKVRNVYEFAFVSIQSGALHGQLEIDRPLTLDDLIRRLTIHGKINVLDTLCIVDTFEFKVSV